MKKIALYLPFVIGIVIIIVYIIYRKRINAYVMNLVGGKIISDVPGDYAAQFDQQAQDPDKPNSLPNVPGNTNAGGGTGASAPQYTPNYSTANLDVMLRKGAKGNEVLILQTELNNYLPQGSTTKLTTDGKFGEKTRLALVQVVGMGAATGITLRQFKQWEKDKSLQTASGYWTNFGT
jgi:hypothetical protein